MINEAQVLEFESISKRPIVRMARPGELPVDYSTRVSARLDKDVLKEYLMRRRYRVRASRTQFLEDADGERQQSAEQFFARRIKSLVSCLDVDFEYIDDRNSVKFSHSHDWLNKGSEEFLAELYADFSDEHLSQIIEEHAHRLSILEDYSGNPVARASIPIGAKRNDSDYVDAEPRISVGGLVQPNPPSRLGRPYGVPFSGVLPGETRYAARDTADASLDNVNLSKWATEQATKFRDEKTSFARRVAVTRYLYEVGGETHELPIGFLNNHLCDIEELKANFLRYSEIFIPIMERSYDEAMYVMTISDIPTSFFVNDVNPQVGVFDFSDRGFEFEKEFVSQIKASKERGINLPDTVSSRIWSTFSTPREGPNSRLRNQITEIWGPSISFEICRAKIYSPPVRDIASERWVVRMSKGDR